MGFIAEPTPEMRNWHNELRGESWWLRRDGLPGDGAAVDKQGLVMLFPVAEVDAVLAALQQARESAESRCAATRAPAGRRDWQIAAGSAGWVALHGPFAMLSQNTYEAEDDFPGTELLSAEIEYVVLTELTRLLGMITRGA